MNHFWQEFYKNAASLTDLRKFTGNKISKRVKAEYLFDDSKIMGATEAMYKMPFKELKKQKMYVASIAKKIPKGDQNMRAIGPAVDATQKGQPIIARGSIYDKPDAKFWLQLFYRKKLKPKEKEFMNRAWMAHELDEKKMVRKMRLTSQKMLNSTPNEFQAKTFNTHMSPGIILREGNLLATAPKNYSQPTKKLLQAARENDYTAHEIRGVIPNYVHGETRLSRHAIKHVENGIKRRNEYRDALGRLLQRFGRGKGADS